MTHPLIKLAADAQTAQPKGPFGMPELPHIAIPRLIEYAKSQHLIITVTPDTDAKRAALLKAREELDAQIAALPAPPGGGDFAPIPPASARTKTQHDNAVNWYQKAHNRLPTKGDQIGVYFNGNNIYYGDY